jgi:hypothetical protein
MTDQEKTIDSQGNVISQPAPRRQHVWGPSRVNHGEAQCIYCLMTNREAWVLGPYCPEPHTVGASKP